MKKTLLKYFVELTGNPISSKLLKAISQSRISRPLIKPFAKVYHINLQEMEYPVDHYHSLNDFFTRRLKQASRSINVAKNTLVSPVDGVMSDSGPLKENRTFHIKNHTYTLDAILGSSEKARFYQNGYFYIFYLSPSHYHHIHYPIDGTVISRYALGGKSYPVNSLGLRFGDQPFATNYRIISELETGFGKMAMVKVGALNINSINLLHAASQFKKGEELGYFSFGSTVMLFLEKNDAFDSLCKPGTEIMTGQPVGKWEQS
ncbi:phosphatidylserine decarboxylase [Virgibacillus sp. 179-BFC.A HS]|uniref:Phosphatidylserine decarboxylase proenzyme n=1 Tax=Tigheibacillus jepli TaxID=3035914 RepID=A0ABU5CL08_9BACI|nr:phosphatidylserine decarboxylase [Virgibacillus sp. 179-BFC.A HS]MDY0407011.1 phosphatidylserine decarboxylase [Virgibacillus sp. 179-BFC.A HS]